MEISFREKDTHLVVVCQGEWTPDAVTEMFMRTRSKATQTSHTRILINWLEVSPPKAEFHRYLTGEATAQILPPPFRVVALYPRELITKFAEDTAVNRFADLYVYHKKEDALQWLLETDADDA